ncbi:MAG: hypothetical protein MJ070_06765 [Lachnospiraceae bacterium]|nr:hypothetical protein [Lachnospiraceae bacterium]
MRYEREETDSVGEKRRELAEKLAEGKPLSDAEALALLLTYTVKGRDTSAIAERLLYRFHGLSGVLEAPVQLLVTVPGVTTRSAALLKLTPALRAFRYGSVVLMDGRGGKKRAAVKNEGPQTVPQGVGFPLRSLRTERSGNASLDGALRRMRGCFSGERREAAGVLLLDREDRPISFCRIGKGENGVLTSDMRAFARELLRSGAAGVIIAHNHPSGPAICSDADLLASGEIRSVVQCFGARVVGNVIFGKEKSLFFSPEEPSSLLPGQETTEKR